MRVLKNYVHGTWMESTSIETLPLVDPATEQEIARVPAGSEDDVADAVESAAVAAAEWAATPLEERLEKIEAVATTVAAHTDELAEIECAEMGKPPEVGRQFVESAVGRLRHAIGEAREYPFVEAVAASPGGEAHVQRQPLGVVATIVPWNFTVWTALEAVGPLLAAGNTVILKPSEKSPIAAERLVELLELPPGVLNLVQGDHRAGAPLADHPRVGLTHFTGSVRSGRLVAAAAARHLRRVVLELGGKDPAVIDADVDVAETARAVAAGAFLNSGQICTSIERIYVHREVADDFTAALVAEAEAFRYGDGRVEEVSMGPLVDEAQRRVVESHVKDAVARGARVLCGGMVPERPGFFYPATVLAEVDAGMAVMQEETFGPLAPVEVVDSFEQGLERAAASSYGLAATVFSHTPEHVEAAQRIPAAVVWVNEWQGAAPGCIYEPAGESGFAATGGRAAFDAATRPVTIVRAPGSPVSRPDLAQRRAES
jgi:acyl-CoA reductase-like NAD-dependent aldehyde dehydrogenase